MTSTAAPPRPRPGPSGPDRGSNARAATTGTPRAAAELALRTTAVGLIAVELVVLVLWAFSEHSGAGAGQALRTGIGFWLAAHHVPLHVGATRLSIAPYGLTALPAVLLWRGTPKLLTDARRPAVTVGWVAVTYAVLTTVLALVMRGHALHAVPAQAFVGGAVFSAAVVGAAGLRHGLLPVPGLTDRPDRLATLRPVLRGAAVGIGVVAASGALLTAGTLVRAHAQVASTGRDVAPSTLGGIGLLLVEVLALPHLVVYGASFLLGPGFGLGRHTSLSLAGAHFGAVPALPVLAALPASGPFPTALLAVLVVPVAAGALAGRSALLGADDLVTRAVRVGWLTVAVGLGWGLVAVLADGAVGPGRLAVTGPSPWRLALAAAAEVAVGATVVALVAQLRARRDTPRGSSSDDRSDQRSDGRPDAGATQGTTAGRG